MSEELKKGTDEAHDEASIKLSEELKKVTDENHKKVKYEPFVEKLRQARIERSSYRVLLSDYYFVYKTLVEECRRHKDNKYIRAIHYPHELERTLERIKEDLVFYYGEDWEEQIKITEATREYVDRLKKISDEDPILLISHHYVRYFGDLSGGFFFKEKATRAMNLPSTGEGVRFYCFDNDVPDEYRSQLDSLQIDQATADKIVEEANLAFRYNIQIFREIDALAAYEQD